MAIKGSEVHYHFLKSKQSLIQWHKVIRFLSFTQNVGSLQSTFRFGIPTSGTIKFSDFYSKRLNVVVDCFSGGDETRTIAKNDK